MHLPVGHCQALCAWLLFSSSIVGCASVQTPQARGSFYGVAGVGVTQFDPETLGGTLVVEEDTDTSFHLGLGYQFNSIFGVEFRGADLGEVEFDDGRTLGYQLFDATGLFMLRLQRASLFARLGVGTFNNDGDFDVELVNPVHPVAGAGVSIHATNNLDFRFSVSAHDVDATWGKIDLVWHFGSRGSQPRQAPVVTNTSSRVNEEGDDGFTSIDPVVPPTVNPPSQITQQLESTSGPSSNIDGTIEQGNVVTDTGLLIDEKPNPIRQVEPGVVPEVELIPGVGFDSVPEVVSRNNGNESVGEDSSTAPFSESQQSVFEIGSVLPVGPLQFDLGAFVLSDSVKIGLEEIIGLMRTNPALRLTVEAHAAPVGDPELNMLLSRRRALSVIRYLVEGDVDVGRLRPRAFGDTSPLLDANSIEVNDRVELRVR